MTVITRPDIKSLSETGGLLSILEQHLEEVHTLYNQRQDLVHSLSGTLPDILLLDNRIDANLDGLRCYHNAIDKLLDVLGESVDNGFIFTASILATETKNTELLKCILAKVESEHDSLPGLLSAYSWIPEGFTKALVPRLFSLSTIGQILALHLCQHHFIRAETQLEWALTQDNVNIQTAGLDTVSTLGLTELLPACRKLLASTDERVAMHAQRTCVLLEQNPSFGLSASTAHNGCAGHASTKLDGILAIGAYDFLRVGVDVSFQLFVTCAIGSESARDFTYRTTLCSRPST